MTKPFIMVSLYVRGDELNPEDVTTALGIHPTRSQIKGEQRTTSHGTVYKKKNGAWVYEVDSKSCELKEHLDILLDAIDFRLEKLDKIDGIEDVFVDIFYADSTDEDGNISMYFDLNHTEIARLNSWGIPVQFTISVGKEDE